MGGFNPFCNSKVSKLKKSGGAGYTETKSVRAPGGNPVGANSVHSPFTSADQLIGLKTTLHDVNAYIMKKDLERPQSLTGEDVLHSMILYGCGYYNGNPVYDKPCLMVEMGNLAALSGFAYDAISICPGFYGLYSEYDILIYAYETTSDVLGLGVTVEKGWYAANSKTLSIAPFPIEEMPLFFYKDGIMKLAEENGWVIDDYFYEIAPFAKDYTFTITEQLASRDSSSASVVCSKFSAIDDFDYASYGLTKEQYAEIAINLAVIVVNFTDGVMFGWLHDATVQYETIHPIDPKFIPGVCLPVVEITTEPTEEGAALTEVECAMLNEVAKTAAPIVVRSMEIVCCASYMGAVGVDDVGYTFNYMSDLFVLQRVEGGSWVYITAPLGGG